MNSDQWIYLNSLSEKETSLKDVEDRKNLMEAKLIEFFLKKIILPVMPKLSGTFLIKFAK